MSDNGLSAALAEALINRGLLTAADIRDALMRSTALTSDERWHYVISEPVEFRLTDRAHTITTTLSVSVKDGAFVILRDGVPVVT